MRSLVVFDSVFGNTEDIARAVGGALANGTEVSIVAVRDAGPLEHLDPDLLVVGCPTQRRSITPELRAILAAAPREYFQHRPAAAFDTRRHMPKPLSGSAASVIARQLRLNGCRLIAAPESFLVRGTEGPLEEGELERAQAWGAALLERLRLERLRAKR